MVFRKKFLIVPLVSMLVFSACTANNPQPPVSSGQEPEAVISEEQLSNNISAYYQYLYAPSQTIMAALNWNKPSELHPDTFVEFFSIKTNLAILSTDATMITIPASIVERYIQRHFDVESNYIKQSQYYNAQSDYYSIPMHSGGGAPKVIGIEEKDNIIKIKYEFYSRADDITVTRTGELTIKTDSGDFQYLSNKSKKVVG